MWPKHAYTNKGVFSACYSSKGYLSDESCDDFTGNGFRAAFYFSRHGYIQHLVIPKEHAVSHICYFECLNCLISPQKLSTNTSLQGPYVYYAYTCVHRIYTVQWIFDYLN